MWVVGWCWVGSWSCLCGLWGMFLCLCRLCFYVWSRSWLVGMILDLLFFSWRIVVGSCCLLWVLVLRMWIVRCMRRSVGSCFFLLCSWLCICVLLVRWRLWWLLLLWLVNWWGSWFWVLVSWCLFICRWLCWSLYCLLCWRRFLLIGGMWLICWGLWFGVCFCVWLCFWIVL